MKTTAKMGRFPKEREIRKAKSGGKSQQEGAVEEDTNDSCTAKR